ncbi:MAG: L,D-transpeptidase [Patescibacteria group bacterium]
MINKSLKNIFLLFCCFVVLLFWKQASAVDIAAPLLKIYSQDATKIKKTFYAFPKEFSGGGNIAVANLGGTKKAEIIVGAGPGGGPQVRVFSHRGKLLGQFFAFDQNFRGGVRVAAGDILGNRKKEIIISPQSNKEPWVVVFKVKTKKRPWQFKAVSSFLAYDQNFQGGVNVAAGNVTGSKKAEIIIASGLGSAGHIRVFSGLGKFLGWDVFPYGQNNKGGADVAVGNVDGGKYSEIITSILHFGEPRIKVYKTNNDKRILGDFLAFASGYKEGVNVTSGDIDSDKLAEIIASTNGGGPQVRAFEAWGKALELNFFPYSKDFYGGVKVGIGNLFGKKKEKEIAALPGRKILAGRGDLYKYIEVDIGEQILRAYLAGKKVNEFLVSTGTYKYPTPIGNFQILWKLKSDRMRFEYGPNHPDNYDLPNVPNVLYFSGSYSLHGTYWHSNFGHRMSHGCVNLSLQDAAWLYDWANYGDPVLIRP